MFYNNDHNNGKFNSHIAATNDSSSVIITWSSPEPCNNDSIIYYGLNSNILNIKSNLKLSECINFTYGNSDGLHYIHNVKLINLNELTKYYYIVSSYNINSSIIFNFNTLSNNPNWIPNIMVFGDLGHKGGPIAHKLFTALPCMCSILIFSILFIHQHACCLISNRFTNILQSHNFHFCFCNKK